MRECVFGSLPIYSLRNRGTLCSYFLQALLTQHKQEEQTYVNLVTVVLGSKVASDAGRSGSAAGFKVFSSASRASWGPSGRLDLLGACSGYTLVWEEVIVSLSEAW